MTGDENIQISKAFIESLTGVPVILCRNHIDDLQKKLLSDVPDFYRNHLMRALTDTVLKTLSPKILYHFTDALEMNYLLFLYNSDSLFFCGPYLTETCTEQFCRQILWKNHMNSSMQIPMYIFLQGLPFVPQAFLASGMYTAMKTIFRDDFELHQRHYNLNAKEDTFHMNAVEEGDATLEALEKRYYFEKMILKEVANGNSEAALRYYHKSPVSTRLRVQNPDPLRTYKNLSFSLNTMLRESAGTTGIHPIYLDLISTEFSIKIEQCIHMEELDELRDAMILSYCDFVRSHRLDQYSPHIRKAITYIQVHLADHLSLNLIASNCNVSASYLSKTFNREVKSSITAYIMKTRLDLAAGLLKDSQMGIQDIAGYVGFSDISYFTCCFRKQMGVSPAVYRKTANVTEISM